MEQANRTKITLIRFTRNLILLFILLFAVYTGLSRAQKLNISCRNKLDCPPGYICVQGNCTIDPNEQGQCDPFAEDNSTCPEIDIDSLEDKIKSGSKTSNSDNSWDF